jgi:hypothetical protein
MSNSDPSDYNISVGYDAANLIPHSPGPVSLIYLFILIYPFSPQSGPQEFLIIQ